MAGETSTRKRCARERIEIPVRVLKKFRPGSAPKQPPISLLPQNDTDAYIVNKIIRDRIVRGKGPDGAFHDQAQRQQCYTIGWRDLPAARALVPCTSILEYVSPWALEDWEYKDCLRREEEEWAKAVEGAKRVSLGMMQQEARPKKRRGRPPRAALMDEAPPTPILESDEEKLIAKKRKSGPSLSTPQKNRVQELYAEEKELAEEAEDSEDSEDAIYRQLHDDMEESAVDSDMQDQFVLLEHGVADEDAETPVPGRNRTALAFPMAQQPHTSSPLGGVKALGRLTLASSAKRKRDEAVSQEFSKRMQSPLSRASPADSSVLQFEDDDLVSNKSAKVKSLPLDRISKLRSRTGTPLSSRSKETPRVNGTTRSSPQLSSFPPAARNHSVTSGTSTVGNPVAGPLQEAELGDDMDQIPTALAESSKKKKAKKRKEKQSTADLPPEEQGWEVKRLEGDKVVEEADGTVIRYFKVRWKGEWPPDQNPTWEPEENITRGLVKKYLKKKARRAGEAASSSPQKVQHTLSPWLGKKYKSVTEAFEGDEDEIIPSSESPGHQHGEDELMVTEKRPQSTDEGRNSFDLNLARQFALFNRS